MKVRIKPYGKDQYSLEYRERWWQHWSGCKYYNRETEKMFDYLFRDYHLELAREQAKKFIDYYREDQYQKMKDYNKEVIHTSKPTEYFNG